LCEGSLGTLACHDVPLLGSANNQLKQKKRQVWHFMLGCNCTNAMQFWGKSVISFTNMNILLLQ
jgi:hypothetical protein